MKQFTFLNGEITKNILSDWKNQNEPIILNYTYEYSLRSLGVLLSSEKFNKLKANDNSVKKIMNMKEVAEYLGITYDKVKSWKKQGLIPHMYIGRNPYFAVDSIDKWLNNLETGGN